MNIYLKICGILFNVILIAIVLLVLYVHLCGGIRITG